MDLISFVLSIPILLFVFVFSFVNPDLPNDTWDSAPSQQSKY